MIDRGTGPRRWLIEGRVLCPSHAEGSKGAALYREPLPVGKDGLEAIPLWSDWWAKRECEQCKRERWDVV